jgi:hypothetical protein
MTSVRYYFTDQHLIIVRVFVERAAKLGLNPPQEVKNLLSSKNADKEEVKECIFHGRV